MNSRDDDQYNNPFDDDDGQFDDDDGFDDQYAGHAYDDADDQPYGEPEPASFHTARPPKESKRKRNLLLAFAVGLGMGAVFLCCGGGVLLVNVGTGMLASEIQQLLADNPLVQEHLGEIQSFEMDFTDSLNEGDEDTYVYEAVGTKGSGHFVVEHVTDDAGDEELVHATLKMSGGLTVNVYPLAEEPAPE